MNRTRTAVAGLAGLAALIAVVPAVALTAATASAASHTITFTSHPLKDMRHGSHDIQASRDVQSGKSAGFDVTDCTFSPPNSLACTAAVARANGMIYAKFRFNPKAGTATGRVTGGNGSYKGATGTLSGQTSGKKATTVTLTYHTP